MLESFNANNEMQYQKLSAEEQAARGILGRLVGVMADFKNPTRNGRKYTEELWDKTFNNPIMQEKFENRCLFGELGHPVDRQEIDMEKIAICLAEPPKKGTDGKLYGVFDILATPNGRILKTMCDYGCKIGVSSRGSGDTFEDYDGNETVEPDSYECECWDAVLLPAVKAARPQYVTESLDTTKTLRKALREALENSTEDEQRVMEETLNSLDIDYSPEQENNNPEKVDNINEVALEDTPVAAEDNGAGMIQELQEALKAQQDLEKRVKSLQEQLSVCYTKEARYSEVLTKTKTELANETTRNSALCEQVATLNAKVVKCEQQLNTQAQKLKALHSSVVEGRTKHNQLNESVITKDAKIKSLKEEISSLKESYNSKCNKLELENKQLQETLEESKKDSQIIRSQASAKINKSQQLVEKYKVIAMTAIDKYIQSQARRLGVNPNDIKNRLNENYSFSDIDNVCSELQKYKLTVNSLPFNINGNTAKKMTIKESKEVIIPNFHDDGIDDEIDTTLTTFLN